MKITCLFLLTLVLSPVSQGEVTDFSKCRQFFVNGFSPTVLKESSRYQQICQCLLNKDKRPDYYYATLYDTANKIPVYSAYEFKHDSMDRKGKWYVEPQLDGVMDRTCMDDLTDIPKELGKKQALDADYSKSDYHRGHLYPVYHTSTKESMEATFTLTNAAPQDPHFNTGHWRIHEKNLAQRLEKECSRAYVVTGVIPGKKKINERVRVADFYWSASCCLKKDGSGTSDGYFGPVGPEGRVETLTLKDLEERLSEYYEVKFSVFGGNCV